MLSGATGPSSYSLSPIAPYRLGASLAPYSVAAPVIVPLVYDNTTFTARQATRLRNIERRMQSEIKRNKKKLEREIEQIRAEFLTLNPCARLPLRAALTNEAHLVLKRHGSTDLLNTRKMKTLFTGLAQQSDRRFKLRFNLHGFDSQSVRVFADARRLVIRASRLEEEEETVQERWLRKLSGKKLSGSSSAGFPGFPKSSHHQDSELSSRQQSKVTALAIVAVGSVASAAAVAEHRRESEQSVALEGSTGVSAEGSSSDDRLFGHKQIRRNTIRKSSVMSDGATSGIGMDRNRTDSTNRVFTRKYCRKIFLPQEVNHKDLRCKLYSDGILLISSSPSINTGSISQPIDNPSDGGSISQSNNLVNRPLSSNSEVMPTQSIAQSTVTVAPKRPKASSALVPPDMKLGVPIYRETSDGLRWMQLAVDVGQEFKAEDIMVQAVRDTKLSVKAKREQRFADQVHKSKYCREFDLPERVDPFTLRAGLVKGGCLLVGAVVKGHGVKGHRINDYPNQYSSSCYQLNIASSSTYMTTAQSTSSLYNQA